MVNHDDKTPDCPELYKLAKAMLEGCYSGKDSKEIMREFLVEVSRVRSEKMTP